MITEAEFPAAAFDVLRNGGPEFTLFSLTLGTTTYRFTSDAKDTEYDGETWSADTPLVGKVNVSGSREEGVVGLVLRDLHRTWAQRFDAVGQRGNAVEVRDVVPYGTNQLAVSSAFLGRTLRVAPIRPRDTGGNGYGLTVECADAAAVPFGVRTEWATNDYQQRLVAETAGVTKDDSHVDANVARRLIWYRT